MKRYSYALLRDYLSARGLTLSKLSAGGYQVTNGVRFTYYTNLRAVTFHELGVN